MVDRILIRAICKNVLAIKGNESVYMIETHKKNLDEKLHFS